jgi:EAL domain-containing protein (putative c-di-GMP-specific phosphodiesterase class I)/CheY-like chemotaxis protein/GGDEF domain-containing protein
MNIKELKEITKNFNILYVEDEDELRIKTTEVFKHLFKNVHEAVNGTDGLEKYKNFYKQTGKYYDIVITDINMPIMDGIELSKNIYEINKTQYILVISAYNDSDMLEKFIELGIDGFIKKPIVMTQFINRIYKVSKSIQLENESIENQNKINALNEKLTFINEDLEKKVIERTKQIEEQFLFDNLTNLGSYASMIKKQNKSNFHALILIDIDGFSRINNLYGYSYGDDILLQMSKAIKSFNENNKYSIYRISSDKFVLYETDKIENVFSYEDDLYSLSKYLDKYQFFLDNIEFNLDTTLALSVGQENPLVSAEMALSHAKKNNLDYQAYNNEIDVRNQVSKNIDIRNKIKFAIENKEVFPVFQPIVDTNGDIVKYEILMRIFDGNTTLYPDEFLDIAIQSKQYNELCKILFEKTFEKMENSDKDFSINLSYEDIYNHTIVKYLEENLKKYPNTGKRIIIEILETLAIEEKKVIQDFLNFLKPFETRVAIDDFGTGHSNFSHVLTLNPDFVKIDGVFIKDILENKESQIIVKSIIYFAKKLSIKVIAEYVHNQEIFELLKEYGVDEFQGYFFSKPLKDIS